MENRLGNEKRTTSRGKIGAGDEGAPAFGGVFELEDGSWAKEDEDLGQEVVVLQNCFTRKYGRRWAEAEGLRRTARHG